MSKFPMVVLGFGPANVPITQEDLDFCREQAQNYEKKRIEYIEKAQKAFFEGRYSAQGAYMTNAKQARKNVDRMWENLKAQESWIGKPWRLSQ